MIKVVFKKKKLVSSLSPWAEVRFLLLMTHRWPHPSLLLLRSLLSVVDLQSCSEKFVTNMCLRGDEWLHNAGSITVSVVIAVYHPAFFKSVVRCLYFGLSEKSSSAVCAAANVSLNLIKQNPKPSICKETIKLPVSIITICSLFFLLLWFPSLRQTRLN